MLPDMPDIQFTRLVGQTVVSKKILPSFSLAGTAHSQDPDSDLEPQTSTAHPMEGEVFDQEAILPEQELDEQVSEEQTYWSTIRGVRSFMGWKQVPEFESSSSYDNNQYQDSAKWQGLNQNTL